MKNEPQIKGYIELYYESSNITYVLNCLFDKHLSPDKKWCSLILYKDYGHFTEVEVGSWDNSLYLVGLYNEVLIPWVIDKKILNPDKFTELLKIEGVSLEDFEGILELFNKAKQFNMIEL